MKNYSLGHMRFGTVVWEGTMRDNKICLKWAEPKLKWWSLIIHFKKKIDYALLFNMLLNLVPVAIFDKLEECDFFPSCFNINQKHRRYKRFFSRSLILGFFGSWFYETSKLCLFGWTLLRFLPLFGWALSLLTIYPINLMFITEIFSAKVVVEC